MKKRLISLFLVIIFSVVTMLGCKKNVGTSEDNAIVEEEEQEEQKVYKFGFTSVTMDNPFFITLEQSLRDVLEQEGHVLITKDPAHSVEAQITQIDEMITDGIEALFISPVEWNEITPALEHLKAAGVKIINIDSEVKEFDYVDAYIGSDNRGAGIMCAERLIELFPDGGRIVICESRKQNSVNERIKGFEEAIADKGFEIVERIDAKGDLNIAWEEMTRIFQEDADIDAVMCGNDQSALGVLVAANAAGLKDIKILGVDGSPDIKKELTKSGTLIYGTCAQSPVNIGQKAAKIGIAMLSGEEYEHTTYEDVFFIDAENVHTYGIDGWQ